MISSSDAYPLVFDFLKKSGLVKSAAKFLKEIDISQDELEGAMVDDEDLISIVSHYRQKIEKRKLKRLSDAAVHDNSNNVTEDEIAVVENGNDVVDEVIVDEEPVKQKRKRKKVEDPELNQKSPKTSPAPFKRVDDNYWSSKIVTNVLTNNSYSNTFGEEGYGAKASRDLIHTRGKDFRHEKTKKKRGSYRGGKISLDSNSFKFDNDDDDENDDEEA